jgi:hypothetical protein
LRGLTAELAARGVKTDRRAVWVFLRAEGLSFKKRMARPVCKRVLKTGPGGLRKRIRSCELLPAAKIEIRAPLVLIKDSASQRRFLNQAARGPVDLRPSYVLPANIVGRR